MATTHAGDRAVRRRRSRTLRRRSRARRDVGEFNLTNSVSEIPGTIQSVRSIRRASYAHGTCTCSRRMQGIESDTGYDTRRRSPDGVLARLSQTTVYDTILTGHARPTPDRSGPKCHLSHSGCWLDVKSPSHK